MTIARKLIGTDRLSEYGNARDTHERIAAMWNALIPQGARIRPVDVALMMTALKLVRASKNIEHEDSFVDAIGYLEIASQIVKAGKS